MAGAGGGRRSAGATPRVTRSSALLSVVSEPRGDRNPQNRSPRGSAAFERHRRSPRVSELEAWAASMNALFEEAERFHLVVE
ncbi:sororin-like [Molothrus aeneus]|uniref:sororin-like n=1 Tax=Molothrus aeneus TaxID=84833 RepID=UPI00345A5305